LHGLLPAFSRNKEGEKGSNIKVQGKIQKTIDSKVQWHCGIKLLIGFCVH